MNSVSGNGAGKTKATTLMVEELKIIEDRIPPTDDVSRRIAIRSIFSSIEILLSDVSAFLVRRLPPPADSAPHEGKQRYFLELCALSDITYEIKQNGKLAIKPRRIQFKNRVLFVLNMLDKTIGGSVRPTGIEGWQQFQDAVKIRDRITHPKTKGDLSVSQEDYHTALKALRWFTQCHHRACGGSRY